MVSCHISPQLVAPVGKKQDPNVGDSYVAESQGQKVPTDFGHLRWQKQHNNDTNRLTLYLYFAVTLGLCGTIKL